MHATLPPSPRTEAPEHSVQCAHQPVADAGRRGRKSKPDSNWQADLADMITNSEELLTYVGLDSNQRAAAGFENNKAGTAKPFPVRVTRSFADRIVKGDAKDPLLLQVIPQLAESAEVSGYHQHPLQESQFQAEPGILQKYHGRALLVTTGACAIHCRYCFRRNFPYQQHRHNRKQWQQALNNICRDESLAEIVLSGGDPLMLSDKQLACFVEDIESFPQITTLRIHTRLPIVLPGRVTTSLLSTLADTRLNTAFVVHSNHANELSHEVGAALQQLRRVTHAMLNQTVLLKGINDCSDVLGSLSKKLFSYGTMPYYLHMLDRVNGAAHFETEAPAISKIITELRHQLPGYLVPRAVREIPGELSKSPLKI